RSWSRAATWGRSWPTRWHCTAPRRSIAGPDSDFLSCYSPGQVRVDGTSDGEHKARRKNVRGRWNATDKGPPKSLRGRVPPSERREFREGTTRTAVQGCSDLRRRSPCAPAEKGNFDPLYCSSLGRGRHGPRERRGRRP